MFCCSYSSFLVLFSDESIMITKSFIEIFHVELIKILHQSHLSQKQLVWTIYFCELDSLRSFYMFLFFFFNFLIMDILTSNHSNIMKTNIVMLWWITAKSSDTKETEFYLSLENYIIWNKLRINWKKRKKNKYKQILSAPIVIICVLYFNYEELAKEREG